MIVVDASVFIDLIFDYSSERTAIADALFKLIEENKIPIFQPDAFKIELIGQLVRRLKKDEAAALAEEIFGGMNFIESSNLFDTAFSIAFQTGSRAIDSFYIAAADLEEALLVSNDNSTSRYGRPPPSPPSSRGRSLRSRSARRSGPGEGDGGWRRRPGYRILGQQAEGSEGISDAVGTREYPEAVVLARAKASLEMERLEAFITRRSSLGPRTGRLFTSS